MKKAFSENKLSYATLCAIVGVTAASTAYSQEVEEVMVTGIRQSLAAATETKRLDTRIVDAIVAEDIGKLPDNNIAEALQRITGVSINTDFGVGKSVSIRGLPQNRVEINGRSTVGDSRDGISLNDFPSNFLKSIEVIKSPTADMIEGALGGTVSMHTVRPLDLSEMRLAGSLDAEYADKTENWAPIFNASLGDNWDLGNAGTFGAIGMLSYQDRIIRQDEFYNRVRLYDDKIDSISKANTPSGKFAVREQNTQDQYVENRKRTAFNLSLQWAPSSDAGNFYLDLNATDRSGSQEGNSILDVGGSRTYNANTHQDGNGQINNYTLSNAFVIPKTWSEFRETKSSSHAFGGEWSFTDKLLISGELAIASSDSKQPNSEFNLRPVNKTNWKTWAAQYDPAKWAGNINNAFDKECRPDFDCRHTVDAAFLQNGGKIPSVIYSDPQALLSPENLAIRAYYHDDTQTKNDETAIRFDVEYQAPFGAEFIPKLKAGIRTTERDYKFTKSTYRADNIYRHVFTDVGTADEAPFAVWMDDFEEMFPGTFSTVKHHNTFNQTGLSGQYDLGTYRTYRGALLADAEGTFARVQKMLEGTNYATTGSLASNTVFDENAYRDIAEETTAMYVSADLDFNAVTAVIGGRHIKTDVKSKYYKAGKLIEETSDYSDFLPSLNVTYAISDETQIRFAAAKVMRRADFNELSAASEINNGLYAATRGSIELAPYRATQFDISVEHYFGESNLLSFAVYYKDVESFLSNTNACLADPVAAQQNVTEWENICRLNTAGVDNPELVFSTLEDFADAADVDAAGFQFTQDQRDMGLTGIRTATKSNGDNGKVKGFELGYQHAFDFLPGAWSGLGLGANYTYADSEQPNGNTLLDISENTLNTQIYWEYSGFQLRLAYNFRDRFLDTEEEVRVANVGALALNSATNEKYLADGSLNPVFDATAGNNYRENRGQFDFSASWDISDNVTLVTNMTNLTGEPSSYSTELGSKWKYTEADRRFSIGIRAKL